MIAQRIIQNKIPFVALVVLLVATHIAWDYYNGGVPTHYLLHNKDLPGFSNWWGLLTIPLSTIISIYVIQGNYKKNPTPNELSKITYGFIAGLFLGVLLGILWIFDLQSIMPFVIGMPIMISFFTPVHYAHNFLGFILGMSYTFGGVLSIIIGLVLVLLSFLVWIIFRKGVPYVFKKIFQSTTNQNEQ